MQNLINDLLAFSRVGTKGKELKPVDFEVALQHVLTNLQQAIEESDARITHDPLPTLMADFTQMEQLLQNLVGNSIKFRHAKIAPIIHIGIKQRIKNGYFQSRIMGLDLIRSIGTEFSLFFKGSIIKQNTRAPV